MSKPKDITLEEFKRRLEGFLSWTSHRSRPIDSWFLSLEEWASMNYNAVVRQEKRQANIESAKP